MQHLNYLTIYYFANNNSSLENDYLLLFEKSIPYLHKDIFFSIDWKVFGPFVREICSKNRLAAKFLFW